MKSVLEKECAFSGSKTFGSVVPSLSSAISPEENSHIHGFLGAGNYSPCSKTGGESGAKIQTISRH